MKKFTDGKVVVEEPNPLLYGVWTREGFEEVVVEEPKPTTTKKKA
mgnify:CR=1 FL=1